MEQVEQVKIFSALYSTRDYVDFMEEEANKWLKGLANEIKVFQREFCCSGGAIYLVYHYTVV